MVAQNLPRPISSPSEFILLHLQFSLDVIYLEHWGFCSYGIYVQEKNIPLLLFPPSLSVVSLPFSPFCLFVVNVRAVSVTI